MQPRPAPTKIRATEHDGIYQVSSSTDPNVMHTVDIRHASRPRCTCEAGRRAFRDCTVKPFCRHVRFAINYRLWQREQRKLAYANRAATSTHAAAAR